jgi:hypothetical protein
MSLGSRWAERHVPGTTEARWLQFLRWKQGR